MVKAETTYWISRASAGPVLVLSTYKVKSVFGICSSVLSVLSVVFANGSEGVKGVL